MSCGASSSRTRFVGRLLLATLLVAGLAAATRPARAEERRFKILHRERAGEERAGEERAGEERAGEERATRRRAGHRIFENLFRREKPRAPRSAEPAQAEPSGEHAIADVGVRESVELIRAGKARAAFAHVLQRESIGGNAGRAKAAVNMVVDRKTGRPLYIGNYSDRFFSAVGRDPDHIEVTVVAQLDMAQLRARLSGKPSSAGLWSFHEIIDASGRLEPKARAALERSAREWLGE